MGSLRDAVRSAGGIEVGSEGDSVSAVFDAPGDALRAAVDGQRRIRNETWPDAEWRVRMAVHGGEVRLEDGEATGIALHESARLRNAAHGGQIIVSDDAREALSSAPGRAAELLDLGLHEIRDFEGPVRVWQAVAEDLPSEFPPLRTKVVRSVPRALSPFLGRRSELSELEDLIDRHQLLTVVGPGGSGKTRLALELAARADGVDAAHVVELATLSAGELVGPAISAALSAPGPDAIPAAIGDSNVLLVLDNCEHVIEACSELVATLLGTCAGLRVVATSREPLRVSGEITWPIPPLSRDEAVTLFFDRASIDERTDAGRESVAGICGQLEDLPLAIELAAARLRSLTLGELASRLDDQLSVLQSGARDVPRHRTLRAMLDWSYELLEDEEQVLLRRLSVFVGGFDLAAAEAVTVEPSPVAVVSALDGLVLRSLVEFDRDAGRYRLLEPVRQYAADLLDRSGETGSVRAAHTAWIRRLVEFANRRLFVEQTAMTRVLDRESGNIAAAIDRDLEAEDHEDALRIIGALGFYWFTSRRTDAVVWVPRAIEVMDRASERTRARALLAVGMAFCDNRDEEMPVRWFGEAADIYRRLGNDSGLATTLFWLGRSLGVRGRMDEGHEHFVEGYEVNRRINSVFGMGWCKSWIGTHQRVRGDLESALATQMEVIELGEAHGVPHIVGAACGELAEIEVIRGRSEEALAYVDRAIDIYREIGDRWQSVVYLNRRATLTGEGDLPSVASHVLEALTIGEQIGWEAGLAGSLLIAAVVLADAGRVAQASILISVAEDTLRRESRVDPQDAAALDRARIVPGLAERDAPAAVPSLLAPPGLMGSWIEEKARRARESRSTPVEEGRALGLRSAVAEARRLLIETFGLEAESRGG